MLGEVEMKIAWSLDVKREDWLGYWSMAMAFWHTEGALDNKAHEKCIDDLDARIVDDRYPRAVLYYTHHPL